MTTPSASVPSSSNDGAADAAAIRDLVERWHRLTAAGDVDAVAALMTEDAVFLGAGQPPMSGRDAFRKGLKRLLETHRIESSGDIREVEVRQDLGYARAELVVRVVPKDGGGAVTRRGSALSIFRRGSDGTWRLSRDANLLGPPSA
jgi:uncharacterized protein (TIGR02246 family)